MTIGEAIESALLEGWFTEPTLAAKDGRDTT